MAPTGAAGLICLAWEEAGVCRSGRPASACHPFNQRKEMALTIASDMRHYRRRGHPCGLPLMGGPERSCRVGLGGQRFVFGEIAAVLGVSRNTVRRFARAT